jgi:hypothetical protein
MDTFIGREYLMLMARSEFIQNVDRFIDHFCITLTAEPKRRAGLNIT